MDERSLRELLIQENEEFKKAHELHQSLESELETLHGKPFLSSDEEMKLRELKKKKLALKDRMYQIMEAYQRSH